MSDLPTKEVVNHEDVSSSHYGTPAKMSEDVSDVGNEKGAAQARPSHIGRKVSEWEALQIAAAGDMETIDNEVQDLEAEVTSRGKSRSDIFQLSFKDPRHYTWYVLSCANNFRRSV